MVDVTPAGITAGNANDESVVHASDADVGDLSRSHKERDISRLQAAFLTYDATKTYNVGDITRESGLNFICVTAITIPEVFTVAKWNFIDVGLGIIFVAYNTDIAGPNQFFVVNGGNQVGTGTEANAQAPVAGAFRLSFYTISIQANNRPEASEWAFRKNAADGNGLITVAAGLTGTFQDLTNVDDMILGDLINYQYRELVNTTGAITFIGSSCATSRTPE